MLEVCCYCHINDDNSVKHVYYLVASAMRFLTWFTSWLSSSCCFSSYSFLLYLPTIDRSTFTRFCISGFHTHTLTVAFPTACLLLYLAFLHSKLAPPYFWHTIQTFRAFSISLPRLISTGMSDLFLIEFLSRI